MSSQVGMQVEAFKLCLKKEVTEICTDLGKFYDKEADRGYAFELWTAAVLLRLYELELDESDYCFRSRDLKIDIAFDDEETKTLVLGQTKFASLSSLPDLSEDEIVTFFDRHKLFMTHTDWVRQHSSDELHDLIADYAERVGQNWNVNWYFISTGKASERLKQLINAKQQEAKTEFPNVNFFLWDFYALKEEYIRSQSIEAAISDAVEIQFATNNFIFKGNCSRPLFAGLRIMAAL